MMKGEVAQMHTGRVRIAIALVIVALAALGCSRGAAKPVHVPVIKPPAIKMPSPNAFDFFTAAGRSLAGAGAISQAGTGCTDRGAKARAYTAEEKVALVEKNRMALSKFREGLRYDYQHPLRYGIEALYPEYTQFRRLAYLLAMESQAKAAKGDWAYAASCALDGLMLGELIAHGDGNGIGRLVGIACQNIVRPCIWDAIPHLDSTQAKAAIARMQDIRDHHFPIQESLKCEKICELLSFQDSFAGKCKDPMVKDWPKLPDYIKAMVLNRYSAYMDRCIRNVQMPYASRPVFPEIKQSKDPRAAFRQLPADMILAIVCPSVDRYWFTDTYCQARNRLLTTALALQAYRADHGAYPASLADLSPAYLKSIPSDPFALKGAFGYRREGERYVLWSVGPDCSDDNGKPIIDPKAPADAPARDKHRADMQSKGDIVAGIHM